VLEIGWRQKRLAALKVIRAWPKPGIDEIMLRPRGVHFICEYSMES